MKLKGLGRGLDALLDKDGEEGPGPERQATLRVEQLQRGRYQPRTKMDDTGIPLRQLLGLDSDGRGARVLLLDVSSAPAPPGPSLDFPAGHVAMMRYEWSKQEVEVPGLLLALEQAASRQVALQDMLVAADKYRTNHANEVKLTHNLLNSPFMNLLIVNRAP